MLTARSTNTSFYETAGAQAMSPHLLANSKSTFPSALIRQPDKPAGVLPVKKPHRRVICADGIQHAQHRIENIVLAQIHNTYPQ